MTTATLDTLAIARKPKAAGVSDDRAEAVTGVILEVRDADLAALATTSTLTAERSDAKYDILKRVLSAIGFQTIAGLSAIITPTKGLRRAHRPSTRQSSDPRITASRDPRITG